MKKWKTTGESVGIYWAAFPLKEARRNYLVYLHI